MRIHRIHQDPSGSISIRGARIHEDLPETQLGRGNGAATTFGEAGRGGEEK